MNRLLFIRICEDKGLLSKKISNGGIEKLREQLAEPILGDTGVFKQIVQFSYGGAKNIYSHFYEKDNPLDWYETGDGELDRALNRVLWILNQFNFAKVDRDILGKLYEKYLPKEERKRLGEFYTQDEVIDYILDAVEYSPSKAIESKDLIDPACGSGGFLVRAARRLIARHAVKFGKATPKEALDNKRWQEVYSRLTPKECEEIVNSVAQHVHGFDINPFAVSITEMNLLFQIVDLYSKAAKANNSFKVPRFKVYETDSLEKPTAQTNLAQFYGATGKSLAKDKDATDELKNKKYDFVVGNPPYVRQEEVKNKLQLQKDFSEVYDGRADLFVYFIELGIKLLNEKGSLSYITSNKFMKTGYGLGTRRFILDNTNISQIIDFGDSKIFEDATNYPCIFVINKPKNPRQEISGVNITDKTLLKVNELYEILALIHKKRSNIQGVDFVELTQDALSAEKWQIISAEKSKIITKMKTVGKPLYPTYSEEVIIGMRTGYNDAFIIDNPEEFEEELIKKVTTGRDIEPFAVKSTKYCIYSKDNDEKLIPRAIKHLSKFKATLENRAQFKQRPEMKWFEIEQPVSKEKFEMPKIMTPAISEKNSFYFDENGLYCFDSCNMIFPKPAKKDFAYYLTAVLNSKAIFFVLANVSPYVQAKYFTYKPQYLKPLPIPKYIENNSKCKKIAELSRQLHLFLKKNPTDEEEKPIADMKNQIDGLVFDLYGLTEEERRIIEKAVKA
ncbi:N-6 DNA methylase [Candidatus Micrarchaeota archaeon]|nr:N-6 DNA methylase [Candidatus Micrarchaeota archaeon]